MKRSTKLTMRVVLTVLAALPLFVNAVVEEDVMPTMLQECYAQEVLGNNNDLDAQSNCLQKYMEHVFGKNIQKSLPQLDQAAFDWINSLGKGIHLRMKRQTYMRFNKYRYNPYNYRKITDPLPTRIPRPTAPLPTQPRPTLPRPLPTRPRPTQPRPTLPRPLPTRPRPEPRPIPRGRRLRKEIRTLTDEEREAFFAAVNALKTDFSVRPNKYDVFALMHQGAALDSAHGGPNFPGWHRYYLYLFEEALNEVNPTVALPYWDSRLDFRMERPEESILWTEIFLGNPKGVVYTGPFGNWRTPSNNTLLRRDIPGPDSSLIDPERIRQVFLRRRNHEIFSPTAANDDDNLERHHDAVHRYVGGRDGHMGGLTTSPQDPVFFLHHCFIDYLWEVFRERQEQVHGIDPERDYPDTTSPEHQPNRLMDNLTPPRTNLFGYSRGFTQLIYRYADAPTCENNCGGGVNVFLHCNRRINACESRAKSEFLNMDGFSQIMSAYVGHLDNNGQTGSRTNTFSSSFDSTLTSNNPAPGIHAHFRQSGIVDPRTRQTRGKRSVTPNHYVNSLAEVKDKVAILKIGVVNMHHLENPNFEFPREKTLNITIDAVGFSYNGRHVDHIVIDKKTHYSESTTPVIIKKPMKEMTSTYIRAFDSYGGICRPKCLSKNGLSQYNDCSGVLKITDIQPLMYQGLTESTQANEDPVMIFQCEN